MSLRGTQKIPRFARNRLCNPTESLRGAKRRSNLIKEIATLPSVARNDNLKTINAFVLIAIGSYTPQFATGNSSPKLT
jgi:hypothetical protein